MELVNPVPVEEVEPWLTVLATALLGSPWDGDFARRVESRRRDWHAATTWGVRDRGRWVATLATGSRQLTVPGSASTPVDLEVDALTAVSVAATHTRRGLLRQMITQSLTAAVDRGAALSVLIAAEWPIYGRYGYAPATRASDYTYFPRVSGAAVTPDPSGALRQVDTAELDGVAAGVFGRARLCRHGQLDRPGPWWPRRLGLDGYRPMESTRGTWILHEGADGPDGLLCWRVTRDFELDGGMGAIEVLELCASTDVAYRNLWSYLSRLDVIGEVRLRERPVDEAVRWLLPNGRALRQEATNDNTWLRLLDVPAALSSRGYAACGRVVLEIVDTDAVGGGADGFAAGRYLLDASTEGATCTRTTESADLVVPQRALASAYLGDQSVRALAVAGGVEEVSAGAIARADSLFATAVAPWNATAF